MRTHKLTSALFFISICLLLFNRSYAGLIVISEIMRNPMGHSDACPGDKCDEYIEFTNVSQDTFSLNNLFLKSGSTVDSVYAVKTPLQNHLSCIYGRTDLYPLETAVIIDNDYTGSHIIADKTVLLTVNHTSILGGLTDSRGVFLYRGTKEIITDSIAMAADSGLNPNALLLTLAQPTGAYEEVSLCPSEILFNPVKYSSNRNGSDPGRWDFLNNGIIAEHQIHKNSTGNNTAVCLIAVLNLKASNSQTTSCKIIRVRDETLVFSGQTGPGFGPHFFSADITPDTSALEIQITGAGERFSVQIDMSSILLPVSHIKINEIFPRSSGGFPEWFELVNVSTMPVNIKNWCFGTSFQKDTITNQNFIINPGAYAVITSDYSEFHKGFPAVSCVIQPKHWQTLDNYRDTLHLWNHLEPNSCETVFYDYKWFSTWNTESLERTTLTGDGLSQNHWVTVNMPSPGQPNSTAAWRSQGSPSLKTGPVPFTPDGDGIDDFLSIEFILPADASVKTSIYSFKGDCIFQLPVNTSQKFLWNGKTSSGQHAPIGPFFVCAEITQNGKTSLIRKKGVLWRR